MTAQLTHDATGPAVSYGLTCMEHPSATRRGLTQAHALNAIAKHDRDHHEATEADAAGITAACLVLLESYDDDGMTPGARLAAIGAKHLARLALEALTGLTGEAAIEQARTWAEASPAITAHVSPF